MNCGMLVHIKNGRIIKVKGNKEHPVSQGYICARGATAVDFHYHPRRLNYPLKRAGKRGEGKWSQISWDDALDEVAKKLQQIKDKHGSEALAHSRGTYRTDHYFATRFFNLFGSPNIFGAPNICFGNPTAVMTAIYGGLTSTHYISPKSTKCLVLWGGNPAESYPRQWSEIIAAKKLGVKIITIDPRFSAAAKHADIWLKIKPGTDCALALAWLNVIIENGIYDQDFVERWTYGFEILHNNIKNYTPTKMAKITLIPEEKIIESAMMYAKNRPALISLGVKIDQLGKNATYATQAQCILRAITGNLDNQGGELMGVDKKLQKVVKDTDMELNNKLSSEQKKKQIGSTKFKLMSQIGYELMTPYVEKTPYIPVQTACNVAIAHAPSVWRAIISGEPYPVKALIVQANNPLLQATNTKLVYEALEKLDLLVVMDYFMTPTAMMADYVFPAADWLERPVMTTTTTRNYINVGERAVKPEFQRRTDYQLWRGLGIRLGQEEYWPWKTLEDCYEFRIRPLGYSLKDFSNNIFAIKGQVNYMKYEQYGFATPSGKVELYSTIFKKLGYYPLPVYQEPAENGLIDAAEYPYILVTGGRVKWFYHSEFRQITQLRDKHPDPLIEINPKTAEKLNIKEGEWVWIETPLGRIKQRAKFSDIPPEVVHAEHSWWFPEKSGNKPSLFGLWESNVNVVISDNPELCDPLTGSWPHRTLCKIYKVVN